MAMPSIPVTMTGTNNFAVVKLLAAHQENEWVI